MDFGGIARDWLAPIAGAYLGYGYGGAMGAGIGAAAGRFGGSYLTDEDSDSRLRNTAFAGALGYGGGKGLDWAADKWGGDSAYFGSGGSGVGGAGASAPAAAGAGANVAAPTANTASLNMPMAMMGLNALSSMYGASAAEDQAAKNYQNQLNAWKSNAFPNMANVNAQTASATAGINRESAGARQRMYDQMAARGMGANSGVIAGSMAEEDRARRARLAALAEKMITYQNTPMYAPPQYAATQSAGEKLADTVGSSSGLLAGMGLYNYMR